MNRSDSWGTRWYNINFTNIHRRSVQPSSRARRASSPQLKMIHPARFRRTVLCSWTGLRVHLRHSAPAATKPEFLWQRVIKPDLARFEDPSLRELGRKLWRPGTVCQDPICKTISTIRPIIMMKIAWYVLLDVTEATFQTFSLTLAELHPNVPYGLSPLSLTRTPSQDRDKVVIMYTTCRWIWGSSGGAVRPMHQQLVTCERRMDPSLSKWSSLHTTMRVHTSTLYQPSCLDCSPRRSSCAWPSSTARNAPFLPIQHTILSRLALSSPRSLLPLNEAISKRSIMKESSLTWSIKLVTKGILTHRYP